VELYSLGADEKYYGHEFSKRDPGRPRRLRLHHCSTCACGVRWATVH